MDTLTEITIFVSCPRDVSDEVQIVKDICDNLNHSLRRRKIVVRPFHHKRDILPLITGEGPQSVINAQLPDYDIYLGIMWTRFGDLQPNGLAPTDEEFRDAVAKLKDSDPPLIQFYFKLDDYAPPTPYDEQQVASIEQFKKSVGTLGYYADFKGLVDFHDKVQKWIPSLVDEVLVRHSKVPLPLKNSYIGIPSYLPRRVIPDEEYESSKSLFPYVNSKDTLEAIKGKHRIVLLGGAGTGKTTELARIASHFSQADEPLFPYLLKLNKYVNQSVEELLSPESKQIPDGRLLLILDGLDEIESKNKRDAVRQIELFVDKHPTAFIVVSCRSNFYTSETNAASGTLSGFSSYMLLNLSRSEVGQYVNDHLSLRSDAFMASIQANQMQDLLGIPFYLIRLVELFQLAGELPRHRAEIIDQLLRLRLRQDVEHFHATFDLEDQGDNILAFLQRLALGMELLGRNYLTEKEYRQIIPSNDSRNLLQYSTVWKKTEGTEPTWQFEHNNFQEYLAAKALATQPFRTVQEFVSFRPEYNKIVPSWVNTLSFLSSILDPKAQLLGQLIDWINTVEPSVLIRFESDKVGTAARLEIVTRIFNHYKERRTWIERSRYREEDLARFGQSPEFVDFLVQEIEGASHYTVVANAIGILAKLEIPATYKARVEKALLKSAQSEDLGEAVQGDALIALADLGLVNARVIEQLLPALRNNAKSSVRSGLYYMLRRSGSVDDNIDVFLDGLKYVPVQVFALADEEPGEIRTAEEQYYLKEGLAEAKSQGALRKVFEFVGRNSKMLSDAYYDDLLVSLARSATLTDPQGTELYDSVLALFLTLTKNYIHKEAAQLAPYFQNTGTQFRTFKAVFATLADDTQFPMSALALLADDEGIQYFAEQYRAGNIPDGDVWSFQSYLGGVGNALSLPFNKLINEVSGSKFEFQPARDFEGERKRRNQEDINLLFDKEALIGSLEAIFIHEAKESLSLDDLIKVRTNHWADTYFSELAMQILSELTGNGRTVTRSQIGDQVRKWNWEYVVLGRLHSYMSQNKELGLSPVQEKWISDWCDAHVTKVNFKTALQTKGNEQTANWDAIILWYFLRKLKLKYPKQVLLDLLSFEWVDAHKWAGIGYLEEQLEAVEISTCILQNLSEGIASDHVLRNHLDFCMRNGVREVLPFALDVVKNPQKDDELRRLALESVIKFGTGTTLLEDLMRQITGELKWHLIDVVTQKNPSSAQTALREILDHEKEDDQFKAAARLIGLQDIQGVSYYIDWIKRHKKFPDDLGPINPLMSLVIVEAVPLLMDLLKFDYEEKIKQRQFARVDSAVLGALTTIALAQDSNYAVVKKALEDFIEQFSTTFPEVHLFHSYLERLEQQYYYNKVRQMPIEEVITRLATLEVC